MKKLIFSILRSLAQKWQSDGVVGIMCHGIFDLPKKQSAQWNPLGKHLHREHLETTLEKLYQHFAPLSLPELLDQRTKNQWPQQPSFFLTFDDGYYGFEKWILPLLEKYQCPATFFPAIDFIDGHMLWMDRVDATLLNHTTFFGPQGQSLSQSDALITWKAHLKSLPAAIREKLLNQHFPEIAGQRPLHYQAVSWEELKRLATHPLITIGNHTVSHPILAREDTNTIGREIKEAAGRLRQELGHCDLFCYPNGGHDDHDNRTRIRIEESHRCALLTQEALIFPETDPYLYPRFSLSANTFETDYFWNGVWGLRDLKKKVLKK